MPEDDNPQCTDVTKHIDRRKSTWNFKKINEIGQNAWNSFADNPLMYIYLFIYFSTHFDVQFLITYTLLNFPFDFSIKFQINWMNENCSLNAIHFWQSEFELNFIIKMNESKSYLCCGFQKQQQHQIIHLCHCINLCMYETFFVDSLIFVMVP